MTLTYYRKAAKIEAFQWDGFSPDEKLPAWFRAINPRRVVRSGGDILMIDSPASLTRPCIVILPGNWVTIDSIGEIDVMTEAYFELRHEPVAA